MYCKNCGAEIASEKEICKSCGFWGDYGDKFCPNCGHSTATGQVMCVNCGYMLKDKQAQGDLSARQSDDCQTPKEKPSHEDLYSEPIETSQMPKEKPYEKYKGNVKKINILSLILHSISVCLILCTLFLPIYKCRYEPALEDIENYKQLEKVLEDGYLEKNFSLVEDVGIIIKPLFASDESVSDDAWHNFTIGTLALFVFVLGIVIIFMSVKDILKTVNVLQDEDNATMLTYDAILKAGQRNKKENIFRKQMVFSFVMLAITDIFFTKIFGSMISSMVEEAEITCQFRNMVNLSGISPFFVIVAVLLVGYLVLSNMKKNETKKMHESITFEQYN